MDRIINVNVAGSYLSKDSRHAGVQHEVNATRLRITFSEDWDAYGKTVTFWDATGSTPTKILLGADRLEDITVSTRVYLCPIPGEAMTEAGDMTFVVDGYLDGVRQRSLSDTLMVHKAPFAPEASEPSNPTPTQAEQLQVQIDTMLGDIMEQAGIAKDAAARAENSAVSAVESGTSAQQYMESAREFESGACDARDAAQAAQAAAETAKSAAETAMAGVESARNEAVISAEAAAKSETAAAGSASAASAGAETATEKAGEAVTAANTATAKAGEAAVSANNAAASASEAEESRTAAASSQTQAKTSEDAAKAAQAAAEKARDEASAIVGGDFATKADAQGYAETAESNANAYTDQKVASIPTPDVSGQIGSHNTDTGAHADIREAVVSHSADTTKHITSEERSKWNGKAEGSHTHDDRYYTESEMDTKLAGKSDTGHTHTPASIGAAPASHTHSEYAPAYTYGTEDLTAGVSELATGKLYFVYE